MSAFVAMYNPALPGSPHVLAPVRAEALYAAHGWLAVDGSTPAPTDIYLTPGVGDLRYAKLADVLPKWKPSTAYASGDLVLNPSGQIVSANTAFTSGGSYSAANWTIISGGLTGQTTTATKTAPYSAAANEIVIVDPTGRTLVDAVANTTTAMTSASGEFTAADVGKVISGHFIPTGTTIASFTSANAVTLSAATTGAVSAANAARKVNLEGAAPVTLPASAASGTVVEVKNMGWGTGIATVKPAGSDDIDGLTQVSFSGFRLSRRFVKGSGTSWTVAGGLTPISGPHSAKYEHGTDLYMPSESCLRKTRAKLAAARASGLPLRFHQKGDSTTYGILGNGGNGAAGAYNPASLTLAKDINMSERMRKRLNASNIFNGRIDSVYAGASMDVGVAGSRFTNAGTLPTSLVFTSAGMNLTMVDDQSANAWDVVVSKQGANPVGATYTIDGGSSTAWDLSTVTSASTTYTLRITAGSVGTHTVVFNGPTSGGFQILSITPVQTATPALIQVRNGGVSGQTLATAVASISTNIGGAFWVEVTQWKPDLIRLLMGINDMHTWTSGNGTVAAGVAAFKAALVSYVTMSQAVGAELILGVFPSYAYSAQAPGAYEAYLYHQAIYDVADTYNCAVWDLQRRWGYGSAPMDYTNVTWPLYDGTHPTLAGYEDAAIAEANILQLIG